MYYYAQEIRRQISVRDICDRYGIEVNRAGFAKCPFHNEKTASLKVYKDGVKCYGCGQYAQTPIDFVMKLFGLSFHDACVKINNDFNLNLAIDRVPSLREVRESNERFKTWKDKRDAEKLKYENLKKRYHAAMDAWCQADRKIMDNDPAIVGYINNDYALAIMKLPALTDALNIAEMELYEYEQRATTK